MADNTFQQHRAGVSRLPFWATGSGETIVAIIDAERVPTRAHALLANTRHVIVLTVSVDATPREAARQVGVPRTASDSGHCQERVSQFSQLTRTADQAFWARAIPCSAGAQQRHKIIRNRVALVGEESVSGLTHGGGRRV